MTDSTSAIVEHYQKTYELTYTLWQQRNRLFLILLGVIGGATLLTFHAPQADSLLLDFVARAVGVSDDPQRARELRAGFPFALLQSIVLMVVFYLMVNLYHRADIVLRNYRYLSGLEAEIRTQLGLDDESVAFTRESTFYWRRRAGLSGLVKWVYIGMLGGLLTAFVGGRLVEDMRSGSAMLVLADLAIGVPTLVFFLAYARSSGSMDRAEAILPRPSPRSSARVPNERAGDAAR